MEQRLSRNARDGRNQSRSHSQLDASGKRGQSGRKSLSELLSADIALENWSNEERAQFEEKFSRRYKRSFFDFSSPAQKGWQFYCPLCGCTRRASQKPTPDSWIYWVRVGVTSGLVTALFWPWLNWKGLLSFIPLWMIFEVAFRIRLRVELACDQCGFDPTLYLSDISRARREVDEFWKRKLGPFAAPASDRSAQQAAEGSYRGGSEGQDAARREEVGVDPETLLDRR